mmetsp:Transcript_26454/g.63752  ORF Transcript_26454/g.63752 Transcript_26454/m.63752 type:complete len:582 (-) Transcript_26454:77-1822(-)
MSQSDAEKKETESQIVQDENKPILAPDDKQDDRPFHRKVLAAPADFANWIEELGETYDNKFLIMLGTAQWGVKGFMYAYVLTSMEWVYRSLGVPGPSIQIYKAVALLPWTMKPLFGVLSDCYPIMGYKKSPYIVLTSLVSLGALIFLFVVSTGITATTACLFFCILQVSIVDLLTEAKYAERMRANPARGPDLITFVWAGITVGALIATGTIGWVLEAGGSRLPFLIAIPFCVAVLVPTLMNYLGERKVTAEELRADRAKVLEQRELLILVVIMAVATLILVGLGMAKQGVRLNAFVAVCLGCVVILAFTLLTRPEIGKMNAFYVIQTAMALQIDGATFYFFTDNAEQYPEGPHFSRWFYTSGTGMVAGVFNLLGMFFYYRYGKTWRYHPLIFATNMIWCVLNVGGVLVYTRYNLVLGIPDHAFVLTSVVLHSIVGQWLWLPGVVLISQLCPKGIEATMYALLAGCHNLGNTLAAYLGALMLKEMGITPDGSPNESHKFDNLWMAAAIQAIAPILTLAILPWMIPNALQTDRLLPEDENVSAVDGSPWQLMFGARPRADEEYGTFADSETRRRQPHSSDAD